MSRPAGALWRAGVIAGYPAPSQRSKPPQAGVDRRWEVDKDPTVAQAAAQTAQERFVVTIDVEYLVDDEAVLVGAAEDPPFELEGSAESRHVFELASSAAQQLENKFVAGAFDVPGARADSHSISTPG